MQIMLYNPAKIPAFSSVLSATKGKFYLFKSNYHCFCYLRWILLSEVSVDHVSFIGLIRLCTDSTNVEAGIQLHCLIRKQGLESNCFLSTALIDFYGKCGRIVEARRVFEAVLCKDLVLWNALVSSYVLNSMIDEAFGLLKMMGSEENGFTGDDFTFSSLLSACRIKQGKQIHAIVFKLSLQFDIQVATTLVHMYAKSNHMTDDRKCFESMVVRNLVSWNAMIVGFGQNREGREAMKLFFQMLRENLQPDELTFASVLSSCTQFSMLHKLQPDKIIFLEVMSACRHGGLVQQGLHYFKQMTVVYKIEPNKEHYACLIDLLGRAGYNCFYV